MATAATVNPTLGAEEAAAILGCTDRSIRRWAIHGVEINGQLIRLECAHAGVTCRFTEQAVREFSEQCGRAKRGEPIIVPPKPNKAEADRIYRKYAGTKAKA